MSGRACSLVSDEKTKGKKLNSGHAENNHVLWRAKKGKECDGCLIAPLHESGQDFIVHRGEKPD